MTWVNVVKGTNSLHIPRGGGKTFCGREHDGDYTSMARIEEESICGTCWRAWSYWDGESDSSAPEELPES